MTEYNKLSTSRNFDGSGPTRELKSVTFILTEHAGTGAEYTQQQLKILGRGDVNKGIQKVRRALRTTPFDQLWTPMGGTDKPGLSRIRKAEAALEE